MLPISLSRNLLARPLHVRALQPLCRRAVSRSSSSGGPKYEAPGAPQPNKHREFYASFGLPLTKVFLGALLTYQVLYWGWLKLESVESKADNDAETRRLEEQVAEGRTRRARSA